MRRPWVKDRRMAIVGGVVAVIVGALLIYDAYERRGGRTPLVLRLITPG